MKFQEIVPIETLHLFPILDELLIELLKSLTEEEWNAKTVAKKWTVKDIASHLLDGNLRGLSISRDRFFGEEPKNINSYSDLVDFLNQLNMTWTNAAKRLSPAVLINLLETTGKEYHDHLQTLNPFENAIFSCGLGGRRNFVKLVSYCTGIHRKISASAANQKCCWKASTFNPNFILPVY